MPEPRERATLRDLHDLAVRVDSKLDGLSARLDTKLDKMQDWTAEHEKTDGDRFDRIGTQMNRLLLAVGALAIAVGAPKAAGKSPAETAAEIVRFIGLA